MVESAVLNVLTSLPQVKLNEAEIGVARVTASTAVKNDHAMFEVCVGYFIRSYS